MSRKPILSQAMSRKIFGKTESLSVEPQTDSKMTEIRQEMLAGLNSLCQLEAQARLIKTEIQLENHRLSRLTRLAELRMELLQNGRGEPDQKGVPWR